MAIIERKDRDGKRRWQVRIATRDGFGKRVNQTVGTYDTKRDAQRAEREALGARDRGGLIGPDRMTVAELLDAWLLLKAVVISPNSKADYESAIRLHLKPVIGAVLVQRLTPVLVQKAYTGWRDGGMSPRMVRRCHVVLSQALTYAVRQNVIPRNPAADVVVPRIERSTPVVWTPDQTRRFLDVTLSRPVLTRAGDTGRTQPDPLSPLWHLLALEGMRRGEALALRWADVNWDRGSAHISRTVAPDKTNKGRAVILDRTKTRASARTVKLTGETLDVLKTHRTAQLERRLAAPDWHDHDLIVSTATGEPVNPGGNISRSLDRLCVIADVPRITVHALRHGVATLLLRAGTPLKIVSERLGHASVSITGDLYSHVSPDMQDVATEAMTRLLERKVSP